jgi:uncharacterized protein YjeT (DUF2065 family)
MGIGYALLLGFGMVLVIEGLAFALAPRRMEELLRVLAEVPLETRRMIGLSGVACGVIVLALVLGVV